MRADVGVVIPLVVLALCGLVAAWLLTGSWIVDDAGYVAANSTPAPQIEQRGSNLERVASTFAAIPAMSIAATSQPSPVSELAQVDDPASVIAARRDEIYNDPDAHVSGNPQGDITIVEFFDYNCPYCRQVASVLDELMQSDPNIRVVYKEFPILGPNSTFAARAALAARKQEKYLEFHSAVMMGRRVADQATVLEFARIVGLDIDRLKTDMENPAIAAILERNLSLAEALHISGTPAFVIADKIYPGAAELADFQQVIAAARKSADPGQ